MFSQNCINTVSSIRKTLNDNVTESLSSEMLGIVSKGKVTDNFNQGSNQRVKE